MTCDECGAVFPAGSVHDCVPLVLMTNAEFNRFWSEPKMPLTPQQDADFARLRALGAFGHPLVGLPAVVKGRWSIIRIQERS